MTACAVSVYAVVTPAMGGMGTKTLTRGALRGGVRMRIEREPDGSETNMNQPAGTISRSIRNRA